MVYVYFVQPGQMVTFDSEISIMQSVDDLKEKIEEKIGIPKEQQVLLINGGECLDGKKNLCSYMAGTDTNPIYLFSTDYDSKKLNILSYMTYDEDNLSDAQQILSECIKLPVGLKAIKSRTQVAAKFCDIAKTELQFCEKMIHEQHLQQQGWSAVIANLEDIICDFKKRWELFLKVYREFMRDKKTYDDILEQFETDKQLLLRIPVVDVLLEPREMDTSKLSETTSTSQDNETSKEISLYEWISSSDNNHSLDALHEVCWSRLQKFEYEIMPTLEKNVTDALSSAEKPERKEIEGLGKRLFDLQEVLRKLKKYVEHQSDMAKAFQMNQTSASQTNDLSILPDLCATHLKQLEYIKEHHVKLMDDRNRVVRAKYELSKSLCTRIDWVQLIENKLWELDSHLVYFHEHFQRLKKHIEVFQQLHVAPTTYMNAILEVVRRRSFSQLFLVWASNLACQQLTIYNEEMTRRKEFNTTFQGHFLNSLFPGMNDLPPPFAIEAPASFDANLPGVTEEDVEKLKRDVPDFAEILILPDMDHVHNFFLGKSDGGLKDHDKDKVDDAKAVEDKLIQAVSDVGLASNLDKNLLKATGSEPCLVTVPGLPALKDDKGCESETDTEEFEKVGQSPLELTFPPEGGQVEGATKVTEKQDASTITEDNLQVSRSEYEKVKSIVTSLGSLAQKDVTDLRGDLGELKNQFLESTKEFFKLYKDLGGSWNNLVLETTKSQNEVTEIMLKEQEAERESFRYNLLEKEDEIKRLQKHKEVIEERNEEISREVRFLEEKIAKLTLDHANGLDALKKQIHEKEQEKEKAVKDTAEALKHEHKLEIDSIKSRFRLMGKSPSLNSLEKDKSGDFVSCLSSNPTLLAQMQDNFELDKERAISEERQRGEKILEEKIRELELRFKEERDTLCEDIAKRVTEDKEKQIDILRERERNLNLEVIKYKTTIQQLTEYEQDRADSRVVEEMEALKKHNEELKEELEKMKSEREAFMTTSVVACEEKLDASTSPQESTPLFNLSKSEIVSPKSFVLNIESCKSGDTVMVCWDSSHENFRIIQESKHTYFLHSDSLGPLNLFITDGIPNKMFCPGIVVDKEYCHAKKNGNRYKVPRGTKFFRVKVMPLLNLNRGQSQSMYQPRHSTAMAASQSTVLSFSSILEESQSERTLIEQGQTESEHVQSVIQPALIQSDTSHFAEDSGIVASVEEATAAVEDIDTQLEDDR